MVEREKSYFKNFAMLFTGNSVSQIVPFLLAPIIGRIFSPEQLAVQENFIAIAALVSIIACGRYEIALVLPKTQLKANNLFAVSIIILICISALSLISIYFPDTISRLYKNKDLGNFIMYLSPAILLLGLNNALSQWVIRSGKYSWITSSRMMQSLTQYGIYSLLGYLGWGINGLIIGFLIGNLLPVIVLLFPSLKDFHQKDISFSEMKSVAHEYKDFPLINSLHAFTDIFATQFLLFWLITRNFGAETLGLFAIMNRYLRAPLNLIGSALGQLYYREATQNKNTATSIAPVFNKSVKIISFSTIPALIIILFWGPDIFALYLGENWREAGEYARIMSPAILFNFISSVVSSTTLIYNKIKHAYIFSIAGYVVSLGVIFIGGKMGYDFKMILWAYSIALSVYYIAIFIWYKILVNSK